MDATNKTQPVASDAEKSAIVVLTVEEFNTAFTEAERGKIRNALLLNPSESNKWFKDAQEAVKILTANVTPEEAQVHIPLYKLYNTDKSGMWGFGTWKQSASIATIVTTLRNAIAKMEGLLFLHRELNVPVEDNGSKPAEVVKSRFATILKK